MLGVSSTKLLLIVLLSALITEKSCLGLSTASFQRFVFAKNGVCLEPAVFYTADDENDGNMLSFTMRNVPGQGDCMFLAVALATATSMGLGGNDALLRAIAQETRNVVAQVLGAPDGNLYIEKNRLVRAPDLLLSAAKGEGLEPEEYLERLRKGGNVGGLQGGGPELTVLSNVLRRPISIYELDTTEEMEWDKELQRCRIKRVGSFGDRFRDPCLTIPDSAVLSGLQPGAYSWHLHVLVLDVGPGEKHACALLPTFSASA